MNFQITSGKIDCQRARESRRSEEEQELGSPIETPSGGPGEKTAPHQHVASQTDIAVVPTPASRSEIGQNQEIPSKNLQEVINLIKDIKKGMGDKWPAQCRSEPFKMLQLTRNHIGVLKCKVQQLGKDAHA